MLSYFRRLKIKNKSFRFFTEEVKKTKKKRGPKPPPRLQTGPPIVHYADAQRKWLFRYSLLCGTAVLGLTAFGFAMPPNFKLKDSISPFSDEKIRQRMRLTFLYVLGGLGLSMGVMYGIISNPGLRKSLYAYGPDNIMGAAVVVAFPACTFVSASTTDQPFRQHISFTFFYGCLGLFFSSHLLVPGVLIRRGLLPLYGMTLGMTLACCASPNPWYLQYFSLINGAFGLMGGWSLAHAFYGKNFRQFEIVWHAFLALCGAGLCTFGIPQQVARASLEKVYDHVYYSVAVFWPLPPERVNDSVEWEEKDYSRRHGGEIIELETGSQPIQVEGDSPYHMPSRSIDRTRGHTGHLSPLDSKMNG